MIDAKVLEAHFDTAFDAPDGIKKLRELILTLAMQGKLVPQDPKDEPASELLKKIEAEKKRLVKEGIIKASRGDAENAEVKGPYELPNGWMWTRLGEIGEINPRNDVPDTVKAGFVPMPLISEGYTEKHSFEERLWKDIKKGYTHFQNGDIGMAKITPCFENAKSCVFEALPNDIGAGTTELHIFRNSFGSVQPRFLLYFLKNPHFISFAIPKMTGSAGQKRVPTPFFRDNPFPLPPLAEQKRIVAKIDQLMARCDTLEKMREERHAKRLAAHAAAIKDILSPSASPRLRVQNGLSPFAFLSTHFSEFYSVRENVTDLRKAILQLAVMGKLVPQDPKDQPASELQKEIQREKARLVKEGKIKVSRGDAENAEVKGPYELPKGWVWVNLLMLGSFLGGKTPSTNNSEFWNGSTPWVSAKDMKFPIIADSEDHVTKAGIDSGLSIIPVNSILMVTRSGILRRTFPVAINSTPCTINQDLKALVLFQDKISRYIYLMLKGFEALILAKLSKAGMTVESIMFDEFCRHPFPLPPLAEQKRIVARIDQLMSLCDDLEKQINATTQKQGELLQSLVAGV